LVGSNLNPRRGKMFESDSRQSSIAPKIFIGLLVLEVALMVPASTSAQTWVWTTETVDNSATATSLVADDSGNIHMSYGNEEGGLKYAFRSVGTSRWFTMNVASKGVNYTAIVVDKRGNPHICATYLRLTYAYFDGEKWNAQEIAPDLADIGYSCSLAISPDGIPHLAWYKVANADNSAYTHLKYGILQDNAWVIRTVDFDPQTGKWNSMALDSQGSPYVCYDGWVNGDLKYAHWDGKSWHIRVVDSRRPTVYNLGMGNSIFFDPRGNLHVSYYAENTVVYARQKNDSWTRLTVDKVTSTGSWTGWRSTLVVDSTGAPHISYEDGGRLKHAFWDGKLWNIQVIAPGGANPHRYHSMTIDKEDTLYISYRDPSDGSLKVAIGRRSGPAQTAGIKEKNND